MKEVEILQHREGEALKLGVECRQHAGTHFELWFTLDTAQQRDKASVDHVKANLRRAYGDHRGQAH